MEYKLFEECITLQALLKSTGIISSGGAIKRFLAENTVLFNGTDEKRRGKKIRVGDIITLPKQHLNIIIISPNSEEMNEYYLDMKEKARISALVKEMNKKTKKKNLDKRADKPKKTKKTVRFPGT